MQATLRKILRIQYGSQMFLVLAGIAILAAAIRTRVLEGSVNFGIVAGVAAEAFAFMVAGLFLGTTWADRIPGEARVLPWIKAYVFFGIVLLILARVQGVVTGAILAIAIGLGYLCGVIPAAQEEQRR